MAPRDEVVDYTLPVFPRITLTLWQPLVNRAPLNYTAFIDVFPMNVWMLIGLTFLVIAVAVKHFLPHGFNFLTSGARPRNLQSRVHAFDNSLGQFCDLGRRTAEIQRACKGSLVMITGATEFHHDEAVIRQWVL